MGRIKVLMRNSASIILIFCLLQISACGGQKSADSGITGKLMQDILPVQVSGLTEKLNQKMVGAILCTILSKAVAVMEKMKFLAENAIVGYIDKENEWKIDQLDKSTVDSTEDIVPEKGQRLFDAYEIEEKEYLYFEDAAHLHVAIRYPQLHGFKDIKKEEKVNQLIEEEAKRRIPYDWVNNFTLADEYPDYIMGLYMLYEIKYMNDDIVSIFYEGLRGRVDSGYYPGIMAMATTIDLENVEVVELTDIITNMEKLCTLLLDDQFENISVWDGKLSTVKISREYGSLDRQKELLEALLGTHEYRDIEWYTDGDNLVIVTLDCDYEEYSGNIDSYPGLVDEDFLEKLRKQ